MSGRKLPDSEQASNPAASSPATVPVQVSSLDGRPDAETVYRSIKALITEGTLKSGDAVSQLELTRMFGVSRTPIREALRRLQAEGLLDAERNHRMRVTVVTPGELDAIYSLRIFLESMGVALSLPLMSPADLAELQDASRAMDWNDAVRDPQQHDRDLSRFKQLAMKYSGEGVLAAVADQFDRCERVRKIYQAVSPGNVTVGRDEHNALLDAYLRRSTEDAVFIASRHLGRTALAVIGYMAPDYEPRAVRFALTQTGRGLPLPMNGPLLNIVGAGPVRRARDTNGSRDKASGE
ncbi:GntR family transcriptional regulator [Roseiarcaceae bacterium H3SJ34-1]|uniref:GntR family transcriptional regulator n=1 Tax=Terripilifer ovatus TaxID=3032367 RepID=UPI003AB926FC|nr:GntR family transcriptional regulator [Roseiarcaceae bacterium H3SJ34-1]